MNQGMPGDYDSEDLAVAGPGKLHMTPALGHLLETCGM